MEIFMFLSGLWFFNVLFRWILFPVPSPLPI